MAHKQLVYFQNLTTFEHGSSRKEGIITIDNQSHSHTAATYHLLLLKSSRVGLSLLILMRSSR